MLIKPRRLQRRCLVAVLYVFALTLASEWKLETSRDQDMAPMRELLNVADLWDVLDAWSAWRGGREPNVEQALRAIRYYDEQDAFIGPELDP